MTTLTIPYALVSDDGDITTSGAFTPEVTVPLDRIVELFDEAEGEIEDDEITELLCEHARDSFSDQVSVVVALPVLEALVKQVRAALVARDSVGAPA